MVEFKKIADVGDRFQLGDLLAAGVFGKIHRAVDRESNDKRVAVKVQSLRDDTAQFIEREYKVLKICKHGNLVDFFGLYRKGGDAWMVMELCEGGPAIDLVRKLIGANRRLSEEHIAYVLKESLQGLVFLHENKVIHRDIKARNILLTKNGDVKLCDFNLSQCTDEKVENFVGSPCWMAPEVIQGLAQGPEADVWSLGVTAIELGDGRAPYEDMHPTRIIFQIVRNPPANLYRPGNWTQNYNDFIAECLAKNPDYRPHVMEIMEHPFLEQIPANNHHLSLELKRVLEDFQGSAGAPRQDYNIINGQLKSTIDGRLKDMLVEDLAALDEINEKIVLGVLEERHKLGDLHTFIGDVLLTINERETPEHWGTQLHEKYSFKSRSDNAPHIYGVADNAYQNAIHHVAPQTIVPTGECGSGKTTNFLHLVDHLIYLGQNTNINPTRITKAIKIVHAMTHASTQFNRYSTRCITKTNISYGTTGKVSGADFKVECLEKWRVSSVDLSQGNFHMLYYLFDGLKAGGRMGEYHLDAQVNYRYLRLKDGCQTDSDNNRDKFRKIFTYLEDFDFQPEQIEIIIKILTSILLIGEIRFLDSPDQGAFLEDEKMVGKIAELLGVEKKKLSWALTNYCLTKNKSVIRRRNTSNQSRDSRDVLANTLYQRLVDYVVDVINEKLQIGKTIFGEKYSVKLLDYFGFECFKENNLPQLFVNCLNEQIQYHYLQRLFTWEIMDMKMEDIDYTPYSFYNNKKTLDELLQKPSGLICSIDQASRKGFKGKYIIDYIEKNQPTKIAIRSATDFSIAHYTGKVSYSAIEMPGKNRDFLPPEIVETLRLSGNPIVKHLFTGKLDKTGNLVNPRELPGKNRVDYSQIRRMRTCTTVFRSVCLELLRDLSGNCHFVRCIKPNLNGTAGFQRELVRQQLRAMAIVETVKARQIGYSCRMTFSEFLRSYKFLAFDFDEPVEVTRENCRLLFVRLKIEDGYAVGKTKVFLRYYNEELLSRLYETQVKKIVKIQSIMRGFLAKCQVSKAKNESHEKVAREAARRFSQMTEDEAASIIQQAFRKNKLESLQDYPQLDATTETFIKPWARKWRTKSIFQVLMMYRASKIQDLFGFAQQVHFYNINVHHWVFQLDKPVDFEDLDQSATKIEWLGHPKPSVLKLSFSLQDIPIYDTSDFRDALTNPGVSGVLEDSWDALYKRKELLQAKLEELPQKLEPLIEMPFVRDPEEVLEDLPEEKIVEEPSELIAKPANKDFDYIKTVAAPIPKPPPPSIVSKPKVDPIAELKGFGRRSSTTSDDPPFNFQGMLRKTNFRRDSVKETVLEGVRRFSLKAVNGLINGDAKEFRKIAEQLTPGLYIEGYEIDL